MFLLQQLPKRPDSTRNATFGCARTKISFFVWNINLSIFCHLVHRLRLIFCRSGWENCRFEALTRLFHIWHCHQTQMGHGQRTQLRRRVHYWRWAFPPTLCWPALLVFSISYSATSNAPSPPYMPQLLLSDIVTAESRARESKDILILLSKL